MPARRALQSIPKLSSRILVFFSLLTSHPCLQAIPLGGQSDSPSSDDLMFGERVEYVMWGFSCRRDLFHDFARLVHASGDELLKTTLRLTTG